MNVLYLIGNGFDLRLGLPTHYKDFLKYYEGQSPELGADRRQQEETIKKYKERFFAEMAEREERGEEQWKNLEIALGEFTTAFGDDVEAFRSFYYDLNNSLEVYLSQFKDINPLDEEVETLYKDLVYPYQYLNEKTRGYLHSQTIRSGDFWDISAITFNYTSSFEQICDSILKNDTFNYPEEHNGQPILYRGIKHVHGKLDDGGILLGVDHDEQIANELFRQNEDIRDLLIKPQSNEERGELVDEECLQLIENADLICLFGLSLGPTDQMWWTAIKKRFLNNPNLFLLYFHYDKKLVIKLKSDGKFKREACKHVIEALGLEGNQKEYKDRIFVAINSDMFPERRSKQPTTV